MRSSCHRRRSKRIFEGAKDFARISLNLPEKFCALFAHKFSPTKIIKIFFWCDLQKRSFLPTLVADFLCQTSLGAIFAQIFRDFTRIFRSFAQIFRDFAQIFDKSELLGVRLHPLHPCLLHHCILQRTSCSSACLTTCPIFLSVVYQKAFHNMVSSGTPNVDFLLRYRNVAEGDVQQLKMSSSEWEKYP